MSRKNTFQVLAMMAMCAANCGIPYGTSQRGTRKRILYVKPVLQKKLREFTIKGHTIMAYSRKDAIKRLVSQGKLNKRR